MNHRLRNATLWAFTALLAPAIFPQGLSTQPSVFQVNRQFHVGRLGTVIPGSWGPGNESIWSARETLSLNSDLTASSTGSVHTVFPAVTVSNTSNSRSGIYHVSLESHLRMDWTPANPGANIEELRINRAGSLLVDIRNDFVPDSAFSFAVQVGSGLNNTALNGVYRFGTQRIEYIAAGLITSSQEGSISFDGNGNYKVQANEQVIGSNGQAIVSPISSSGQYSVAPDGLLTLSGTTLSGAVGHDSEVFFLVDSSATSTHIGMWIGVREGQSYTPLMMHGRWQFTAHDLYLGFNGTLPSSYTQDSITNFVGTTATGGSYTDVGVATFSDQSSSFNVGIQNKGAWTLNPSGSLDLVRRFNTETLFLSMNGELAIGSPSTGSTALLLLMPLCLGSETYGGATPGTGGISPAIGTAGFPSLGNSTFGIRVENALAGAIAVVPLASQAAATGIPLLQGTLWIQPNSIIVSPSIAISNAGDGLLPLPIPAQTSLTGLTLFGQGIVLDPGAAGSLSMTDALKLVVCR